MNNQNINIDHCEQTQITQNQESIFLYTTITGSLQLIHLEEIGYFRYNSKSKLWEVMLSNKQTYSDIKEKHELAKDIEFTPLFASDQSILHY